MASLKADLFLTLYVCSSSYPLYDILLLLYYITFFFDFQVQEFDTLNSVAARFDSTPSELRKLNRLASNLIFPGSTLLVPDKTEGTATEGKLQKK